MVLIPVRSPAWRVNFLNAVFSSVASGLLQHTVLRSVRLSVCLSVCLSACLSVCLSWLCFVLHLDFQVETGIADVADSQFSFEFMPWYVTIVLYKTKSVCVFVCVSLLLMRGHIFLLISTRVVNGYTYIHTDLWTLSGITRVSRYQNQSGFYKARDSEWQKHQLGHMQICTSPQTDNHASC